MSTSQHPETGRNQAGSTRDRTADAKVSEGVEVSEGVAATNGPYNAVAVLLAVIVIAALAYGLVQTAIKASALFTG